MSWKSRENWRQSDTRRPLMARTIPRIRARKDKKVASLKSLTHSMKEVTTLIVS